MSKETLKQAAEKLFAVTTHQVLWGNPKGEFFTSENLGNLSLKADEKLIKFERTAESSDDSKKELSANETIAKIKAVETLEALKEFESDDRKSVKSVYGWKLKALTEAIKVNDAQTVGNGNTDTEDKK